MPDNTVPPDTSAKLIEVWEDDNGQGHFHARGGNNEILDQSEAYAGGKDAASKAAWKLFPGVPIVFLTGEPSGTDKATE